MMIGIKPTGDVWIKEPLVWRGFTIESGKRTAMASCGNGHVASLIDHEIADDGAVTPSLVCPEEGCGFHEFVKLEEWAA